MIDWTRVQELRDEIGADDFKEVVALFLEEADGVASQLRAGLSPDAVEAALHYLKGSALNLGFSALADLCQLGEKIAARGEGTEVDLKAVADLYEQTKASFDSGVRQLAA